MHYLAIIIIKKALNLLKTDYNQLICTIAYEDNETLL